MCAAAPGSDRSRAQLGQGLHQRVKALLCAQMPQRHEPQRQQSTAQQQALQAAHIRRRTQATNAEVQHQHQGQHPHGQVSRYGTAAHPLHQAAARCQLQTRIGKCAKQRNTDHHDPQRVATVVITQHLTRRDIAMAFTQQPLPLEKQHAGQRHGHGQQRQLTELQAVTHHQRRETKQRPGTKGRPGGKESEHPGRQSAAGQQEVSWSGLYTSATDTPQHAVSAVQGQQRKQPDQNLAHLIFRPFGTTGCEPCSRFHGSRSG